MRSTRGPLGPIPPATRERPEPQFEIVYPKGWLISMNLKQYRSHKVVKAAQIEEVTLIAIRVGDTLVDVGRNWIKKHNPKAGGYYVVYSDGYTSFSPQKAFEEGYSEVTDE